MAFTPSATFTPFRPAAALSHRKQELALDASTGMAIFPQDSEETGQIRAIAWEKADIRPGRIGVNLSAVQIIQKDLAAEIIGRINEDCDAVQGYYFSKPLPEDEETEHIRRNLKS